MKDPLSSVYTDGLDDAFSDATPCLQDFKSAEDYERFVMNENAKLLAHTFAEMANCSSGVVSTPSDLDDLVSPSLEILNLEDLSILMNEGNYDQADDEDSRATYNVHDKKGRKLEREKTKIVRSSSKNSTDVTYSLEMPRILSSCSSSSTGHFYTANSKFNTSDTTTYSIDDRPFETPPSELPSKTLQPNILGVKIRETRSSALRAQKTRSMEVKASHLQSPNQNYKTNFMTPSPSLDSAVSSFVMSLRKNSPPRNQRSRSQVISRPPNKVSPTPVQQTQNIKLVNSCSYQSFKRPFSRRYNNNHNRTNIPNSASTSVMQQSVMVSSRHDSSWSRSGRLGMCKKS
jgi:hypothetical protein